MSNRALAVAQTIPHRGDVEANVEQHVRLIHAAADEGASVILFPELSLTGYELDLAEELAFSAEDARLLLVREAARARSVCIVVGAPLKRGEQLHIASLIVSPEGAITVYTKHHLGAFPASVNPGGAVPPAEHAVFQPGRDNPLFSCGASWAALAICADVSRPSHPLEAARRGAKTYLASSFIIPSELDGEIETLRGYATRHSLTVALANYGGSTGGLPSAGRSAIWTETGECLTALDAQGAGFAVALEGPSGWGAKAVMLDS